KSQTDRNLSDSVRSHNTQSSSKSKRSVIQHLYSESSAETLEQFLRIDSLKVDQPSEDFKNIIKILATESNCRSENKTSYKFDDVLKIFNSSITFTGDQRRDDFEHLFRGNRPDFTWVIEDNFYPWKVVSIIEKKKNITITPADISQMLEYLRLIVRVSPKRQYAVGCLTNYKRIIFGKASIINDKFTYERFRSINLVEDFWKFLRCNSIDLGHVKFSVPDFFKIESLLGGGTNSMVYQIAYNNNKYAMKISNKMSKKEFDIAQEMEAYIKEYKLSVEIIKMDIKEDFVLSQPVGKMIKNDDICKKEYIIQILNQLVIGQKVRRVHRDIRINNIILYDNSYAYLIDWDSSTSNGFKGEYEGAFITASTPVLRQYSSSKGKEVSAYYADDWMSIIYMILLSRCRKEDQVLLKSLASNSMAQDLIIDRQEILTNEAILPSQGNLEDYKQEVINRLIEIESERENLRDINVLHTRCMKIIEAMDKLGLIS
ncbi:unnamed protein product, partial [Rotaria sp. Silwood2]